MQDYGGYGGQPGYGTQPNYGEYGQPGYGQQPGYGGYGGYGPPPPPPPGPGLFRYIAVAVVAAALGAGLVVGIDHVGSSTPVASPSIGSSAPPQQQQPVPQQPQQGQIPVGGSGLSSGQQAVVSKVSAGLVIINTSLQYRAEQAAGTGMVVNSDGLVLTNNHVIENATSVSATVVATGRTYRAKVLGYDQTGDIAAIQLQGVSGLRAIPMGDSSSVKTGDSVIAMGNAQGGSQIVPAPGQVTGLNQTITANDENGIQSSETLHNMIQTNAAIVSGDSGGALANMSGQVIGMNTAGSNVQFSQQQAAGFAIPINTAMSVVNQIVAGHGSSTISIGYPPFVGIFLPTSNSGNPQIQAQDQAQRNGGNAFGPTQSCYSNDANMPVPTNIAPVNSGTLIIGVICNSPAAATGMTGGAVITAVNGHSVSTANQLHAAIANYHPGDTIKITWVNLSGKSTTSSLRLTEGPPL
ncbi:MAG TPA: trypsin-like peptidase domain-containing protein [Streptosporangiaceae bacterium]